jgi:4-amino-4-deoxy-L-arabinose transferase-like glycosyltransferase
MNQPRFGRSRLLIAAGAVAMLVGSFLPWYTVGGEALPAESSNAFDGAGIVVFVVAVALLALLAIPYAATDRPPAITRRSSFLALALVGIAGFGLRLIQLWGDSALGLPDRALGLWISGVGLVIVAWGVAELYGESQSR